MSETARGSRRGLWAVLAILAALIAVVLLLVGGMVLLVAGGDDFAESGSSELCPSGAAVLPVGAAPDTVAGYSGVQLTNAESVMKAGADLGVSRRGQTIAVSVAMGESSLGLFLSNPRSSAAGLFHQLANGAWGSLEDRMDPYRSSVNFYRALLAVPGWETMEPTLAAFAVQRNEDPYHYEKYWVAAEEVVSSLAGEGNETDYFGTSSQDQACGTVGAAGPIVDGWTVPVPGVKVNSGFGMRRHPISGKMLLHAGVDLPVPCGTSVHAAAGGTVTWAGLARKGSGRTGNQIEIDHGGGVMTTYGHLLTGSFAVEVGQTVQPGQLIAGSGGDRKRDPVGAGGSTGCHLHLQTGTNGVWEDPVPFMAARGVTFGDQLTDFSAASPGSPAVGIEGGAGQVAVAFAQTQLGDRYSQTQQGGCGPDWWDCSCLLKHAWAEAGKELPRVSRDQWGATTRITRDQLQVGDLVFWSRDGTQPGIYHVAMYVGDGKVIHAPRPGRTVEIVTIWERNIIGYGRP